MTESNSSTSTALASTTTTSNAQSSTTEPPATTTTTTTTSSLVSIVDEQHDVDDDDGDDAADGEEDVDEEFEHLHNPLKRKRQVSTSCPYLDTVDRGMLDFDFQKQCSVTLKTLNVYACLVCGKFFQGALSSSVGLSHTTISVL
jgi:U4/U6.U5 tri-snRNP-associated protein 2